MTPPQHQPALPDVAAAPSRPAGERRTASRRAEDRHALLAAALLGRAVQSLAGDEPAVERFATLLAIVTEAAGARRVAVLDHGDQRRVAVLARAGDDPAAPGELAAWLDAESPRSRADRAAGGQATVVSIPFDPDGRDMPRALRSAGSTDEPVNATAPVRGLLAPGTARGTVLGFDLASERDRDRLPERLPTSVGRGLALALEAAWKATDDERERAELRAQDDQRSRFISTVAHELRTPLTGLGGYLDLILSGRVADESVRLDFMERSRHIVLSMSELVGDLLELSRLEAGSLELELAPFSMADVGERVLERLVPQAMERRIELRAGLPPRIRSATGDRRRVEQILTNLLGNALKFTPTGGTVELSGWSSGPVALFAVRDDGEGIAAADRERVFDRFVRLAAHQRVTGSGLGLPIARELARSMHGDLGLASVQGAGSGFVLALPGPAPVPRQSITDALAAALLDEEVFLEELSVRRALQAAGRAVPGTARPRAVSVVDTLPDLR